MDSNNVLNRLILALKLDSDTALARALDVKQQTVSAWRKRNSFDLERILLFADRINMHWLLTGIGDTYLPETNETAFSDIRNLSSDKNLLSFLLEHNVTQLPDTRGFEPQNDENSVINPFNLKMLIKEKKINAFLGTVHKFGMRSRGITHGNLLVCKVIDSVSELRNRVVIVQKSYSVDGERFFSLFLRYYDQENNQLLSDNNYLAPIPYDPELIVPARITSIIRPL